MHNRDTGRYECDSCKKEYRRWHYLKYFMTGLYLCPKCYKREVDAIINWKAP